MVIEEGSFGMAFCSKNILADSIAFFYALKFCVYCSGKERREEISRSLTIDMGILV